MWKSQNYENSMFPYTLHSTVNFSTWKAKDKCYFNVFFRLFTETITDERKKFFFQNYMKNVLKI